METKLFSSDSEHPIKASKTSLEGWKLKPSRQGDGAVDASKTSLEGWKLSERRKIERGTRPLKNFLRGMETPCKRQKAPPPLRPSKTSLEGWKLQNPGKACPGLHSSKTSLEGWKLAAQLAARSPKSTLKNFLRGMETRSFSAPCSLPCLPQKLP